jgi:hypothetical protein
VGVGLVVMLSFMRDWNRKYREVWLDRDSKKSTGK